MTGWLIFLGVAGIVLAALYMVMRPKPTGGFLGRSRIERTFSVGCLIVLAILGILALASALLTLPRR